MSLQQASLTTTENRPAPSTPPLRGRWLLLARGSWISLIALTMALCIGSLPVYETQLHTRCEGTTCIYQQLTAEQVQTLQGLDWSLDEYAALQVVLLLLSVGVSVGVSTLIVWRRSNDRMALLVALALVTSGPMIETTSVSSSVSLWLAPATGLVFLGLSLFLLVFFLFPSGQFAPRFMRWPCVAFLGGSALLLFLPDAALISNTSVSHPGWLVAVVELVVVALVQLYRYRWVSTRLERQQTKWVVFGYAVPVTVNVLGTLLALVPALAARGSLSLFAINEMGFLLTLFPPLAFGVAILRYRLWDIDLVINRTLVYGALTLSVLGLYVLFVVGLGTLIQAQGNVLLSLLATGLIAVLFQPLRTRLQLGVNRLLYGERDDPYAVLARLGNRLKATLAPEAILPTMVETIAQALKLPHAAITVKYGEEVRLAASYGVPRGEPFSVPIVYQSELVGQLHLTPRHPQEPFTPADRRLLEDIASQAGIAVHAVRLTADLQRSREHLVTTREEERRRLRRDLHDGLGPTLASMTLKLDAARNLLKQHPPEVDPLLVEVKTQLQATIVEIRRLVYDLRPPALDELGLVSALREQARQYYELSGVQVVLDAPPQIPPLPAAVEVAAFRIVLEALTNVARHAQAHTCSVRLHLDDRLIIEVSDDGRGLPPQHPLGVGLASMQERAAELGGTCAITSGTTGGTHVQVRLPLTKG
jgi:signal transduction histidine kinase